MLCPNSRAASFQADYITSDETDKCCLHFTDMKMDQTRWILHGPVYPKMTCSLAWQHRQGFVWGRYCYKAAAGHLA